MSEETLLEEFKNAPRSQRAAILSYAFFVLHGDSAFSADAAPSYVPFLNYEEVDDFLDFHEAVTR